MVTDPATRYGEGAPGTAAGEMPGAADAEGEIPGDADGAVPATRLAGDPLATTSAVTTTAITAIAAASGINTRRQRRPGPAAEDSAAGSGGFAAFFDTRLASLLERDLVPGIWVARHGGEIVTYGGTWPCGPRWNLVRP